MKKKLFVILMLLMLLFVVDTEALSFKESILDRLNILEGSCSGYFGDAGDETSLMHILKYQIFKPIQIVTPIILVIFTTLDFAKVVFDPGKDGMDKAKKNFVKRAITAIIIFFIPYLLTLIFTIVDEASIRSCLGNF